MQKIKKSISLFRRTWHESCWGQETKIAVKFWKLFNIPNIFPHEKPLSEIWLVWMSSSMSSSATFFKAFGFSANFLSSWTCDAGTKRFCCCGLNAVNCCWENCCGRAKVMSMQWLDKSPKRHQPNSCLLFVILSKAVERIENTFELLGEQ